MAADTIDEIRERLQTLERDLATDRLELHGVAIEAEQHVARLVEMARQATHFGLGLAQTAGQLRLLCLNARLAAARLEGTLALDAKDLELRAAVVIRAAAKMQAVAAQLQHTAGRAKGAIADLRLTDPESLPGARPPLETAIAAIAVETPLRETVQSLRRCLGLLAQGVDLTLAWAAKGERAALLTEFTRPLGEMSRRLTAECTACDQVEGLVNPWSKDTLRLRQVFRRLAIGLDRVLERMERMRPLQTAVQAEDRRLAAIDLSRIFDLSRDDFPDARADRQQVLWELCRTWGQARDLAKRLMEGHKAVLDAGEPLPALASRMRLLAVNATLAAVRSDSQTPLAQELTQRADKLEYLVARAMSLLARLQTTLDPMGQTVDSLDRKVFGPLNEDILQKVRSWLGSPTDLGKRAGEASTYAEELGLLLLDLLPLVTVPPLGLTYERAGTNGHTGVGWEFGQLAERTTKAGQELATAVGTLQRRSQATRLAMEAVVAGVKVLAKRSNPLPRCRCSRRPGFRARRRHRCGPPMPRR
ncbi:MAG: hypothetical protein HC918_03435 [Oscillatoriales cyanobacterium SM2_1_8]|nr:hypothetical protein [Oscillatoriales cyanobacterium SM2_1_8]